MSRPGVDRNPRSGRHQADPTGELVAFCNEELPRLDPAVRLKSGSSALDLENCTHEKASFRALLTSALTVTPSMRDDLSSLSCVSFSDEDTYKRRLRYRHCIEPQTFSLSSKQYMKHGWQMTSSARASVPSVLRRFTKSSVNDEIAMSSDHERSVVMRC